MKKYLPVIILILLEAGIVLANVTPHTFLAGWDNLFPEFNLPLNLSRSLSGVWLEYRGPGLYDGMSHIANLIHTVTIWILSVAIPQNYLRYTFILGMHLLGGIGAYLLLIKLFRNRFTATAGAVFYMLNLTTIQMFYAPLEAFSVHFASLPWLSWGLLNFYEQRSRKSYLLFLLVAFVATPQYFVTTLLLPTAILLTVLSVKQPFKAVLAAGLGFLLVNAFWLIPYIWGVPHNAPVIASAKINQMSSGEIFARNQAFGDIKDVLELKGFSLDYGDLATNGTSMFMMAPWREHLTLPLSEALSGILAVITLLGGLSIILKPKQRAIPFLVVFVFGFIFLGTNVPVLRDVTMWLQQSVPFFREAFRFTFTKFSLMFTLSYMVLLAAGLTAIAGKHKVLLGVAGGWAILTTMLLSIPSFQGNFLYKNLRISIPEDYLQLFAYAKTLNPDGRMLILPQPEYWSWKYYGFGYRGSGFTWMGLPQPIMDRAFDPWSANSENFYWELSRALYAKDPASLDAVFNKWNIHYVLLDERLITANNNRSLFTEEAKQLLSATPDMRPSRTFGKLTLYERAGALPDHNVAVGVSLPKVGPVYRWTDNDVAYRDLGDYVATNTGADVTYTERSLFTKRAVSEREFSLTATTTPIYDSTKSADLAAGNVKECGLANTGYATATNDGTTIRFESVNQRGCLSFDIPSLSHKSGYLVTVDSAHITGRPLMLSFINDTARHVELETYLDNGNTNSFILPPLAPDGLGYSVYISNDSIGGDSTVNEIRRIRVYTIPYDQLVQEKTGSAHRSPISTPAVSHPNPAVYKVTGASGSDLILYQSFDPGWIAVKNGKIVGTHVLVNNWANGWTGNFGTSDIIYIIFWPQILEWAGFILLPVGIVLTLKKL